MTFVECPVCSKYVVEKQINIHLDTACKPTKKSVQTVFLPKSKSAINPRESFDLHVPRKRKIDDKSIPLAERLRPADWTDMVGEFDFASLENNPPSMILSGSPGCGKTTVATIFASKAGWSRMFSATDTKIEQIRKAANEAEQYMKLTGQKGIIFIDEIHRFSKAQQDVFLTAVEKGIYTLIGATTENPSFRINSALLSRCRVFVLQPLKVSDLVIIVEKAANIIGIVITREISELIARMSNGDSRIALNSLEFLSTLESISLDTAKVAITKSHTIYDRHGDYHYDSISALHKSIRGGDDNAALYWLMRMLKGGEDPLYIARRFIRIASEDIGLANNDALGLCISTMEAVNAIGMPEADVILCHCAVYLARSPKSIEVYEAMKKCKEVLEVEQDFPVPLHLRNATSELASELGYGNGYIYPPAYKNPPFQKYLPAGLKETNFFTFTPE